MKKADYLLVAIICALAVCLSSVCLANKEGWHEDEISTYAMANGESGGTVSGYDDSKHGRAAFMRDNILGESFSEFTQNVRGILDEIRQNGIRAVNIRAEYLDMLSEATPVWKSADEYHKALTIQTGARFDYSIPIINCMLDNHSPLYYMLVTTASSFFIDTFSKLPAYIVNLAFMLAAIFVFYKMIISQTQKRALAVCATLLFSLCAGAMRLSVLFRMYEILLFFTVCTLKTHIDIRRRGYALTKGDCARLVIYTVLGFLTQYYFAVYALFMAVVTLCQAISSERKSGAKKYIKWVLLSALIGLVIWPFAIVHILFSYRGVEAAGNAASGLSIGSALEFLKNTLTGFMGGLWLIAAVIILSALAYMIIKYVVALKARHDSGAPAAKDTRYGAGALVAVPAILYIVALSVIAPYTDFRYATCVIPALAILLATPVYALVSRVKARYKHIISIALCACMALGGLALDERAFLYPGLKANKAFVNEMSGESCICITRRTLSFYPAIPDFLSYKEILVLSYASSDMLLTDEKARALDSVILYVDEGYDREAALEFVMESAGFTAAELLAAPIEGMNYSAYRLTR